MEEIQNMKYPEDFINRVICGDCLEFMKQIPDKSIDLVLTDPPYGMNYQSARRTATPQFKKIDNDVSLEWMKPFLLETFRILKNNTHIYLFCNDYAISEFRKTMENAGFVVKRTLVWIKNNHTSGDLDGDYGNKTEFILYAHKGRKELNGRRDTNVLNFSRVAILSHPTEKPVSLCGYLIKKSSNENDIILDPFLGSGTTAVACQELHRNFIGIEISEKYCKIAEERLKQKTLF